MAKKTLKDLRQDISLAQSKQVLALAGFGDIIAKDEGYTTLDGVDAVIRYIVDKYHWPPHEVRRFSIEDLNLLLDGYGAKPSKRTGR